MIRYGSRPLDCECEDDDPPFAPNLEVYESDYPLDTGLLDEWGEPILYDPRGPLGFDLSPRKKR